MLNSLARDGSGKPCAEFSRCRNLGASVID
jgi:hypothetical protein